MQVTLTADGLKERTYEMEVPPRKDEIVRIKGDVYNVVEVIWRQPDETSGLKPIVELHRSSL